jgi:pyruvate carboxylase
VLVITEAMKMETNVKTRRAGVIKQLVFDEGDQVEQGDLLAVIE